jgi:peptidoglycan/LPS O-acetylase OafA/YrhL
VPVQTWRLGRRPELDGLRGIAILLVIGGHAKWLPTPSSVAGVNLFFALSGFLITALLLDEVERSGRVSMAAFYVRRARRLLPALVAYLAFAIAVVGVGPTVPVLLYVENWVMVLHGAPAPTAIAWSLSIEEQFYLVWPWVIILGIRWARLPWVVATAGVLFAFGLRLLLWDGGAGQWRIYYGSDTRMDVLLLGCLLAMSVKRWGTPDRLRWLLWPGLITMAACCVAPVWWSTLLDPFVVGVGTSAVIGGALAGSGRWLSWSVLRWFGRRSYALYLWHYVLVTDAERGLMPMWVAIALALALAEVSWRLVERPFLARSSGPRADPESRTAAPGDLAFSVQRGGPPGSAPAGTSGPSDDAPDGRARSHRTTK